MTDLLVNCDWCQRVIRTPRHLHRTHLTGAIGVREVTLCWWCGRLRIPYTDLREVMTGRAQSVRWTLAERSLRWYEGGDAVELALLGILIGAGLVVLVISLSLLVAQWPPR